MDLEEFAQQLKSRSENFEKDLARFLIATTLVLEAEGKKNATEDFYQPTTRSGHTRDYPLTGNLRRSIRSRMKQNKSGVRITLQAGGFAGGNSVDYADDLEFGTERIKPFFFLGRTVAEQNNNIEEALGEFLKLELNPKGAK